MKSSLVICLLSLTLLRSACAQTPPVTFRLKNDLTVAVQRRTESPLVSIALWVRAGSREERNAENGAAHFIEHLVFRRDKQTTRPTPDTAMENLGATLSAATGADYAVFSTTIAATHFTKALPILFDVVRNADFPQEELERERGVILDELALRDAEITEQIQQALYSQQFATDPYRFSPGGKTESIKSLTRATLRNFYRRNYRPQRCALVVVGNIEPERVRTEAERIFGNWIAPASFGQDETANVTQTLTPPLTLYARDVAPQIGIGFKAPRARDVVQAYAAQVAAILLTERLKSESTLLEPTVRYTPRWETSLFQVQAKLNLSDTKLLVPPDIRERLSKAEQAIQAQIARFGNRPPTQAEVTAALNLLAGRALMETETTRGTARTLGYQLLTSGDAFHTPNEYRQKVTPSEVQRFAQTLVSQFQTNSTVALLPDRSPRTKTEGNP